MADSALIQRLPNGLTLLAEPMPWLGSSAFTLLLPAGTVRESSGKEGLAAMTVDLAQRGAGERDSRAVVEVLDYLGVERSSSVSTFHTSFSAAMVADVLLDTLALYVDIVRRPHLPEDQLEDTRQTSIQELLSLEDDPSQKIFTELKRLRYSPAHGRSPYGTMAGLDDVQHADIASFHAAHYVPNGAILAVAGRFDWDSLRDTVERWFGDWQPTMPFPEEEVTATPARQHLEHDSAQTHIALAYRCVPYSHPEFYQSRGLVSVLSDGMSSRLFTEVREKRGLVYAISASSQTVGQCGSVLTYAGTTGGRAQETVDVTWQTIQSLGEGVSPGELARLKARVKSSLIMEQESCSARSSQIASDWHHLGRIVPRSEVLAEIEALSCESLLAHFQAFPPTGWSMVSMGPESVELPHGI
jgi:predicted Zn-dependent peptidase